MKAVSRNEILDNEKIIFSVKQSLKEDIEFGDITSKLIDENKLVTANIKSHQTAILCGISWVNEVFHQVDPNIRYEWKLKEGDIISPEQCIVELNGCARSLLTAERTALNWLQTLSATATQTFQFVQKLKGTKTRLLDTRKTIPGLRYAQKYATKIGGATNHRMGLYDAFLIKENHILSCGSIEKAIKKARQLYPDKLLEIEVENLREYSEAVKAKPDRIMLDNFNLQEIQKAVEIYHDAVTLEVSGDVSLDNIHEIAKTGVDFISVGAITKHIQAVDLSMRVLTS